MTGGPNGDGDRSFSKAEVGIDSSSDNGLAPSGPLGLEQVRALILTTSGAPQAQSPEAITGGADDLDLRETGVIDSLGFIELVATIEDELGIELDFDALDPDEITILGPLARLVHAQAQAAHGGSDEE